MNDKLTNPLDEVKRLGDALQLALHSVSVLTIQELAAKSVPDPRKDLEKHIEVSAVLVDHTIKAAITSGKSCPDLWKDAGKEVLDLLCLIRQRDQLGRAPDPVKDFEKVIRDDTAIVKSNEKE